MREGVALPSASMGEMRLLLEELRVLWRAVLSGSRLVFSWKLWASDGGVGGAEFGAEESSNGLRGRAWGLMGTASGSSL